LAPSPVIRNVARPLSSKEGKHEEWIDIFDNNKKKIGKALVEVDIEPTNLDLTSHDVFKRSITDMDYSFRRALDDFNRTFKMFDNFALPSASQGQQAIEGNKNKGKEGQISQTSPRKFWFGSVFDEMENMLDRTLEDMHNTFEQVTKEFLPSIEGQKGNKMQVEGQGQQKQLGDQPRTKTADQDVKIQEEPLKP